MQINEKEKGKYKRRDGVLLSIPNRDFSNFEIEVTLLPGAAMPQFQSLEFLLSPFSKFKIKQGRFFRMKLSGREVCIYRHRDLKNKKQLF